GKGNYAAFTSPFHTDLQMLYPGALVVDPQPTSAIEDGMSPTMLLSEVRTFDRPDDSRGVWSVPWNGSSLLAFDLHPRNWPSEHDGAAVDSLVIEHRAAYVPGLEGLGKTQRPNNRGPNRDTLPLCREGNGALSEAAEAAGMPCTLQTTVLGVHGYMSAAPRSGHPGGVNAAFLDGRVAFVADDVDELVMASQISVNDGR
ncbi:MAG: DUF1559 domain-containing protein, partial [Planctomycetales bacterium]|nr:DUF1559 domain-containing protein [Planctomycetales bacterium]